MQGDDLSFLNNWFHGLPTVPSHYCRSSAFAKDKKYLNPGTTILQLYKEYSATAQESHVRVVGRKFFTELFHKLNFSVFILRKDQCDVCVGEKHGNVSKEKYDLHIKLKDEARDEKTKDKEAANDKISVWTMDMQAVLLCPKSKASSLYYKTKLQVHNFTLYNLKTKEGYCYTWDETQGDVSSIVFAYLQSKHFKMILDTNPFIENLIIWSDGCGYQNRNSTVSNMYLDLSMRSGVTIQQKYLIAGHTQMECDLMHSTIERKLCCDIYTPRDYVMLFHSARQQPSPYHVVQITFDEIQRLSGSYITSIRPGRKAGEPTVHQLRALKYTADGEIQYKLGFSNGILFQKLPQRINIPIELFTSIQMFNHLQRIPLRKYQDLQSMKPVLPKDAHHYYDTLPHLDK